MTKEPNPPTPFPEKEGGVRGGTGEGSSPFLLREGYAQEGVTSYLPSSAGVGSYAVVSTIGPRLTGMGTPVFSRISSILCAETTPIRDLT